MVTMIVSVPIIIIVGTSLVATRLRTELGWAPAYSDFETGLANTIDWYRNNEAWWAPTKDGVEAFYASKGQ